MVQDKAEMMILVQLLTLLLMITNGRGQFLSPDIYTSSLDFNEKLESKFPDGLPPNARSSSACKDISPMCYAVDASYCNEAPLKTYCKATCGYCPRGVPRISIRPTTGECLDLDPMCHTYKEFCAGTPWVQHFCQKSCGLCYPEGSEDDESCKDLDAMCLGHGIKQHCTTNQKVAKNCPKTCGLCQQSSSISSCDCGIVNDPPSPTMSSPNQNRIVGGKEALKNKYPWMVSIQMHYKTRNDLCGGSIINTRYVLTAGHCTYIELCVTPFEASHMKVTVAEHNLHSINDDIKGVTEELQVREIIRHEDYCLNPKDPTLFNNDIALLLLEKDLDFSHKELGIPCLPEKASSTYDGKTVTVAGWGYNHPTPSMYSMKTVLQEVEFKVMNDCREYKYRQHLTSNMLCAGDPENVKDACGGDSGGPLMYKDKNNRYTQIGVVSFGPPGGNCTGIGVYTNVAHYVDWIKKNTRDGECPTGIAKTRKTSGTSLNDKTE